MKRKIVAIIVVPVIGSLFDRMYAYSSRVITMTMRK